MWTEAERARLLVHLIEREGDAATPGVLDIRLLVGVPFFIIGQSELSMTSRSYMLQLWNAKETTLRVRDQLRIVHDWPPHGPIRVIKRNYRYSLEPVPQTWGTATSANGNARAADGKQTTAG
ncbi:MAG: hypothetical protein ACLQUY_05400 [Ktedonobacterales bacterium]